MRNKCIYCGKANVVKNSGVCATCKDKQVAVKRFVEVCKELKEIISKRKESERKAKMLIDID